MCRFVSVKFVCGCVSEKGSEYSYCRRRGKGCKLNILTQFEWQTFCPNARKALKGKKKYDDTVILPRCCSGLDKARLESLCLKCNPLDYSDYHRFCPGHLVNLSTQPDTRAEEEFEKAVKLWPSSPRCRYFRRKSDPTARDVGWSM
ncbi:hypothetical protein GGS26DRAFT_576408 [Hypomontagnella submonticulosa]|nr:hypothetical protein GGS26DRAFT_576408 [Hypomontagnella submonticulosa]